MANKIKPRERDAILQSLRAGVTPRTGLQHIQVGRVGEVDALLGDLETISDGGATFRLVIGDFGSGKSFFLQLIRQIALEKGLVTVHADLSPDRRLQASGGQAKSLYNELMRNMSTRTKPDGAALQSVVEKFVINARKTADADGAAVEGVIHAKLSQLEELVGGYDFARVISLYYQAGEADDQELQGHAVRWLRGEYSTKTDARNALGVRTIVDDANVYDYLKLWSLFVQAAGYSGLLVGIDELVNLYKLNSKQARVSNYEQILRILNDSLQGSASSIGFLMGGTPEFLLDPRKGLYSYEALRSRLAENSFARQAGVVDYSSPTLYLQNLNPEELYILLKNIREVFAAGQAKKRDTPKNEAGAATVDKPDQAADAAETVTDGQAAAASGPLLPDEALEAFLVHCQQKIGESYFRTPRNTIKAFVDLMSVLEQNPQLDWKELLDTVEITAEVNTDMPEVETEQTTQADPGSTGSAVSADEATRPEAVAEELAPSEDALATFKL